jgi:hypothetical protein
VPNDRGGYQIILVGKLREKLGYNQAKGYSCGPPSPTLQSKNKKSRENLPLWMNNLVFIAVLNRLRQIKKSIKLLKLLPILCSLCSIP